MAKDPALLFYTSDFLIGTAELTDAEVGQYIRLLCYMHQKGRLSAKSISFLIGSCSMEVLNKFQIDKDGNFYSERLELEAEKRRNFSLSRRENGKKGGRGNKKQEFLNDKALALHMGNENENENEIKEEKKGRKNSKKTKSPTWEELIDPVSVRICSEFKKVVCLEPPTQEQMNKLLQSFEIGQIFDVVEAMENKADLLKKYESFYLTCKNWLQRRVELKKQVKNERTGETRQQALLDWGKSGNYQG